MGQPSRLLVVSRPKRSFNFSEPRSGLEGHNRLSGSAALLLIRSATHPHVSIHPSRRKSLAPVQRRDCGSRSANECMPMPIWRRLFWQLALRAASRAICTAGSNSAARMAMIEITTNNSINVNPFFVLMGLRISWFKNVTFFVRCTHHARIGVAEFFRLPAEFAPPYMSAGKPHSSVKSGDSFT